MSRRKTEEPAIGATVPDGDFPNPEPNGVQVRRGKLRKWPGRVQWYLYRCDAVGLPTSLIKVFDNRFQVRRYMRQAVEFGFADYATTKVVRGKLIDTKEVCNG